ncbi:MAG: tryptophan synthase subunit alpha [Nitrospinae bacterium]|nr:tryptophan synthase subunit alpha [Nitrospinota bacterium]
MNRIEKKFQELKANGKKALIVFVTAGDPDMDTTEKLIPRLFDAGADIVEVGIPFSDPMADGPVIQQSFMRALGQGTTLGGILAMTKRVREVSDGPIVYMSAFNLEFHYGIEKFARDAQYSGVDGVIFPDLIPEEAGDVLPLMEKAGIAPIFLVAPTSGQARIKTITQKCRGFVYYVSVAGITGKQKPLEEEVRGQVAMIRKATKLPVAAGFGISTPEQAAAIGKFTDGVIVGSAVVRLLEAVRPQHEVIDGVCGFVRKMRDALDG